MANWWKGDDGSFVDGLGEYHGPKTDQGEEEEKEEKALMHEVFNECIEELMDTHAFTRSEACRAFPYRKSWEGTADIYADYFDLDL